MSKYLVETFYTCTFKIIHKLDELNEKKLSELENRKDGKVEIIDVKLNNRKTKTFNEKNTDSKLKNLSKQSDPGFSSFVSEIISSSNKLQASIDDDKKNANSAAEHLLVLGTFIGLFTTILFYAIASIFKVEIISILR